MDKQNVVYLYNEIQFNKKKEKKRDEILTYACCINEPNMASVYWSLGCLFLQTETY